MIQIGLNKLFDEPMYLVFFVVVTFSITVEKQS